MTCLLNTKGLAQQISLDPAILASLLEEIGDLGADNITDILEVFRDRDVLACMSERSFLFVERLAAVLDAPFADKEKKQ